MRRPYDQRALRRIARKLRRLGLCARSCRSPVDGRQVPLPPEFIRYRELRKALESIEREACLLIVAGPEPPTAREQRDSLRVLADALSTAARLESELPLAAAAFLWAETDKLGGRVSPADLRDLARAADAAASAMARKVRTGPQTNERLVRFVDGLAGLVEFHGGHPTVSKSILGREPYGGKFFELAAATRARPR